MPEITFKVTINIPDDPVHYNPENWTEQAFGRFITYQLKLLIDERSTATAKRLSR